MKVYTCGCFFLLLQIGFFVMGDRNQKDNVEKALVFSIKVFMY